MLKKEISGNQRPRQTPKGKADFKPQQSDLQGVAGDWVMLLDKTRNRTVGLAGFTGVCKGVDHSSRPRNEACIAKAVGLTGLEVGVCAVF